MWARRQPRPLWRSLVDLAVFLVVLGLVVLFLDFFHVLDFGGGNAIVKDGDSLVVDRVEVRLWGIDAPELHQTCQKSSGPYPCGIEARQALRDLVRGRMISCRQIDTDRYGRAVSICKTDAGEINRSLLDQGWAITYRSPGFSYLKAEAAARSAGRGLWQGDFEPPSDFRARSRSLETGD
jgi:endonuclease YncB( thermonuclease family)